MRMTRRRSMVHRVSAALIGLLLAVTLICLSGCSGLSKSSRETKHLYKGLSGSTGAYKKIMILLPFVNNVRWLSTDLDTSFGPELRDAIEAKCDRIEGLLPEDPNFPTRFKQVPRSTEVEPDGAELAAVGRASGVNMVLLGRLVSIRHATEDRGMFWFAKTAHLARIQMEVIVYHTGTGAKLFDETIFQDVDISPSEGALIDAEEMPDTVALSDTLTDIAETMGKAICNVLGHIPWEGYVISVEDNRVVLSAGESCGLKKGKTLRVYGTHEATGEEGEPSFTAPGEPVGSITVTAVHTDDSEAVLKNGGPVSPGSVVRAH